MLIGFFCVHAGRHKKSLHLNGKSCCKFLVAFFIIHDDLHDVPLSFTFFSFPLTRTRTHTQHTRTHTHTHMHNNTHTRELFFQFDPLRAKQHVWRIIKKGKKNSGALKFFFKKKFLQNGSTLVSNDRLLKKSILGMASGFWKLFLRMMSWKVSFEWPESNFFSLKRFLVVSDPSLSRWTAKPTVLVQIWEASPVYFVG